MAQTLTIQNFSPTLGLEVAYAAATDTSLLFANDGKVKLNIRNSNGATRTATQVTKKTVAGLAIADVAVTIDATTGDIWLGPFDPGLYNDPTTGQAEVQLSATAGITVAAVRG